MRTECAGVLCAGMLHGGCHRLQEKVQDRCWARIKEPHGMATAGCRTGFGWSAWAVLMLVVGVDAGGTLAHFGVSGWAAACRPQTRC